MRPTRGGVHANAQDGDGAIAFIGSTIFAYRSKNTKSAARAVYALTRGSAMGSAVATRVEGNTHM